MSSGRSFYNQLNFLGRDFDVFAPDLKGFGDNPDMEYPYSLDDYIFEMKEYMYKTGIVKPHVIAHSFGGRMLIKSSAKDGGLFDKLVFTGSAGLKPKRTLKKTLKKTCFNILKRFVERDKLSAFYSKEYLSLSPVMKESFKLIINEYLDEYLGDIKNPTLIINGIKDLETPPYTARRMAEKIKNSRLIFIDGAGHFCFLDKPNKFNVEVKEFLLS